MADKKHNQPMSQPDPETTHTTDPQEQMEGPVSSTMQGIKENADDNDRPEGKNHDENRDERSERQ
ncbi:MAG TPA: hypothetical protein VD996_00230 [Chitinophagaceae bacterium]|nr:hypothetical protein [Chitinophagaceae bacterium]